MLKIRALAAGSALALATAVAVPPVMVGSGDPAGVNVQAIVDRVNLYVLTS
ncbi:hypothetical protein [Nonomuraea roseola]|uniref:Uncharacterized protein n=1 Tax=Nonomuraea roseola TaxID=46179 RepID=A0ABV5Q4K2_9ACTN